MSLKWQNVLEYVYFILQLTLTRGSDSGQVTCTYAWQTDDGEFGVEINCQGYTTRKVTLSLASAKGRCYTFDCAKANLLLNFLL